MSSVVYVCLKLLLTHLRSWRLLICPRNVWVMFLLYGSSIESTQNSSDPLRYAFKWHAYKGYFITRTSPELRPSCSYKSPAIRNCPEFASLWYRRVRCHWAAIPSVSDAASSRSMSDASRQVLIADTNNLTGPMKFPEMAGSQASSLPRGVDPGFSVSVSHSSGYARSGKYSVQLSRPTFLANLCRRPCARDVDSHQWCHSPLSISIPNTLAFNVSCLLLTTLPKSVCKNTTTTVRIWFHLRLCLRL